MIPTIPDHLLRWRQSAVQLLRVRRLVARLWPSLWGSANVDTISVTYGAADSSWIPRPCLSSLLGPRASRDGHRASSPRPIGPAHAQRRRDDHVVDIFEVRNRLGELCGLDVLILAVCPAQSSDHGAPCSPHAIGGENIATWQTPRFSLSRPRGAQGAFPRGAHNAAAPRRGLSALPPSWRRSSAAPCW